MTKKQLNVADITNELEHSAFFPAQRAKAQSEETPLPPPSPQRQEPVSETKSQPVAVTPRSPRPVPQKPQSRSTPKETKKDSATTAGDKVGKTTLLESMHASNDASMLANMNGIVEAIRKTVKQIGKEVSFVRLLPEEKRQLADIAYTYKSQGIKTSENEISRIGINWMLEDYQAHGKESILAKVLEALNA